MSGDTIPERLARLEEKVNRFDEELIAINTKLDDLLALKNEGLGAFWLASALVGAGALSIVSWVCDLIKGHF